MEAQGLGVLSSLRICDLLYGLLLLWAYRVHRQAPWHLIYQLEAPVTELPAGRALRIQSPVPFTLHYGFNGWQGVSERAARPATFGLWSADLSAEELAGHTELNFTRRFGGEGETWEGRDHAVQLHHAAAPRLKARD